MTVCLSHCHSIRSRGSLPGGSLPVHKLRFRRSSRLSNLRENIDSSNDSLEYGQQHYDLSTLGGQLTPQRSYRSSHNQGSARSHPSARSPQFRHGTANSIKSDHCGREPVSPLERNETPEVHEARVEQLVRAQHGNARVWQDLDRTSGSQGRRF